MEAGIMIVVFIFIPAVIIWCLLGLVALGSQTRFTHYSSTCDPGWLIIAGGLCAVPLINLLVIARLVTIYTILSPYPEKVHEHVDEYTNVPPIIELNFNPILGAQAGYEEGTNVRARNGIVYTVINGRWK